MIYWHDLVRSLLLDHAPCTHPQHQSYIVASHARGGFAPALRHVLNYEEEMLPASNLCMHAVVRRTCKQQHC